MFCNYCKKTTHRIEMCTKLYCRKCGLYGHHDSVCTYEYKCTTCSLSICKDNDCDKKFKEVWDLIRKIGEFIEVIMQTPDIKYTADAMALEVIVLQIKDLKLGTIMSDGYKVITAIKDKADHIYRKFYLEKWGVTAEKVCEDWNMAVKKAMFQGGYGHAVHLVRGETTFHHAVVSEKDYMLLQKQQIHIEASLIASFHYTISDRAKQEIWGN